MRWALLADVHANLEALLAVLAHLKDWPDAQLVCAGDVVGYGPDPQACIALLSRRRAQVVAGNHEGMVLGRLGFERCVYAGIRAALWTRKVLSDEDWAWLQRLPQQLCVDDMAICHGAPQDVQGYVASPRRAQEALAQLGPTSPARLLVCGHTHKPALFDEENGWRQPAFGCVYRVPSKGRLLVNPGAVGQSRDGTVSARYARYDSLRGELSFHALPYEHHRCVDKLRRTGLVPRVALTQQGALRRRLDEMRTRWARLTASHTPSRDSFSH